MEKHSSTDMWLWRMYREVAEYVHNPSAANEIELINSISQYRKHAEQANIASSDEHEWAMNFR